MVLLLLLLALVSSGLCAFVPGRIVHGEFEYPELSGRMSVRKAVMICEADPECAGFTFLGTMELDIERHVGFFRFVRFISVNSYHDIDWNSFVADRSVTNYFGQVPQSGRFTHFDSTMWLPGRDNHLVHHNGTAVAFSRSGSIRFYEDVDLSNLKRDPEWDTYLNLAANPANVLGLSRVKDLNFCCPHVALRRLDPVLIRPYGHIDRVPCSMPQTEFEEKYVRIMKPAIITGCDYQWLHERADMSVRSVTKFYHDNATLLPSLIDSRASKLLHKSFTLAGTPNDFEPYMSGDYVNTALEYGTLRIFNRIRYNYNCQVRNSSCRLFEQFQKPDPIPEDLYAKTDFDNDLGHPHNDPDLTGAWNYLINGYKWWAIFPQGLDAKFISCDEKCSPDMNDHSETYRWFNFVLPQLREIHIYGNKPLEFVQRPGEAVYLPHGLAHSVLNVRDNVAVTENFLFVDALQELMSKVVLDEISAFRPGWEELAIRKLYYGLASKKDRAAMRSMYEQAVRRIHQEENFCSDSLRDRQDKMKLIFGGHKHMESVSYGSLPKTKY